ncbi:MAG: hypothetical protein QNJ98_00475, partial [Planctomycetota bacterium]|nr:hypothetical protein [Planctomycetota bacterium]
MPDAGHANLPSAFDASVLPRRAQNLHRGAVSGSSKEDEEAPMRTVSLAILILAAPSLWGCCCPPAGSAPKTARQLAVVPFADELDGREVLLETTCLTFDRPELLADLPMASAGVSEPLDEAEARALLESVRDSDQAEFLIAPSIVTYVGEHATLEVGESEGRRFSGHRVELAPRFEGDAIAIGIDAVWTRAKAPRLRRAIDASVVVPDGGRVLLVAPRSE